MEEEKEERKRKVEEIRLKMAAQAGSPVKLRSETNGRSLSIDQGTRSQVDPPSRETRKPRPSSGYSRTHSKVDQGKDPLSADADADAVATTAVPPGSVSNGTKRKGEGKDLTTIIDDLLDKAETVLETVGDKEKGVHFHETKPKPATTTTPQQGGAVTSVATNGKDSTGKDHNNSNTEKIDKQQDPDKSEEVRPVRAGSDNPPSDDTTRTDTQVAPRNPTPSPG